MAKRATTSTSQATTTLQIITTKKKDGKKNHNKMNQQLRSKPELPRLHFVAAERPHTFRLVGGR